MKRILTEIIIAAVLVVLASMLLDPFGFLMPTALQMTTLIIFLVAFSIFAGFVWREKSADEREGLHKLIAGRTGYLLGMTSIVIGITIQSFSHAIDPWLVITLILMLLGKLISFILSEKNS